MSYLPVFLFFNFCFSYRETPKGVVLDVMTYPPFLVTLNPSELRGGGGGPGGGESERG